MISRSDYGGKSIVRQIFGAKGLADFLESRFVPQWLPLLLGLALGMLLAVLIANDAWPFPIPIVLLIPALILFSRRPFVAILIWMAVFPFFVRAPGGTSRYIYWILHRTMIPAALTSVILSRGLGAIKGRKSVRLGIPELALVLFLQLMVVNIILSYSDPVPKLFLVYDRLFIPFCMYLLVRLTAPDEQDLKTFLWVAFFTLITQASIGLLSWFMPQVLPPEWTSEPGRTVGTFSNPAVYTTTLMFASLLLLQYAMHSRSGKVRTVLLLSFSLALFCVFFSFSRGSWLGGLAVLGGLLILFPKTILRLVLITAVLALLLGGSLLADELDWAWERLNNEDTAGNRVVQYNAALEMTRVKPLFGWGYDNYDRYSRQFVTRVAGIPVNATVTSHNTYLTLLAEMGVIAFLVYFFPLVYWLRLSIKTGRRLPRTGFWSRSLLVILWLLMVDHFIVSNFMDMIRFNLFGTTVWWMVMGFIANMVYPLTMPGDVRAEPVDLAGAFDQPRSWHRETI